MIRSQVSQAAKKGLDTLLPFGGKLSPAKGHPVIGLDEKGGIGEFGVSITKRLCKLGGSLAGRAMEAKTGQTSPKSIVEVHLQGAISGPGRCP